MKQKFSDNYYFSCDVYKPDMRFCRHCGREVAENHTSQGYVVWIHTSGLYACDYAYDRDSKEQKNRANPLDHGLFWPYRERVYNLI